MKVTNEKRILLKLDEREAELLARLLEDVISGAGKECDEFALSLAESIRMELR